MWFAVGRRSMGYRVASKIWAESLGVARGLASDSGARFAAELVGTHDGELVAACSRRPVREAVGWMSFGFVDEERAAAFAREAGGSVCSGRRVLVRAARPARRLALRAARLGGISFWISGETIRVRGLVYRPWGTGQITLIWRTVQWFWVRQRRPPPPGRCGAAAQRGEAVCHGRCGGRRSRPPPEKAQRADRRTCPAV